MFTDKATAIVASASSAGHLAHAPHAAIGALVSRAALKQQRHQSFHNFVSDVGGAIV